MVVNMFLNLAAFLSLDVNLAAHKGSRRFSRGSLFRGLEVVKRKHFYFALRHVFKSIIHVCFVCVF